jgi:LmbE family N-acetylglucosaminyl deacetylase
MVMKLANTAAQIYVPDGLVPEKAISRTTHLAVGAHQDDIPIMAYNGISQCFGSDRNWFLGITVTDGARSPRSNLYSSYTEAQMRGVRNAEEKKAAHVGEYGAAVLLAYTSSVAKDGSTDAIVNELARLIATARPEVVYTHNLADKHDTHVAVALRTLAAIRRLPNNTRPTAVYGCEVWRDLDWMCDDDKVAFDVTAHSNISAALMGVYDSQISAGKRYDLATTGRRLAHATFSDSHSVDRTEALSYAMDLTPLINDATDAVAHVEDHIDRMQEEISDRISRLS